MRVEVLLKCMGLRDTDVWTARWNDVPRDVLRRCVAVQPDIVDMSDIVGGLIEVVIETRTEEGRTDEVGKRGGNDAYAIHLRDFMRLNDVVLDFFITTHTPLQIRAY